MPRKRGEKAGVSTLEKQMPVVVTHEIHVTERGHRDPVTGEEFGDRMKVFLQWDEYLDKIRTETPVRQVNCIRAETDPNKPFNVSRTVTHCFPVTISDAKEWCTKGLDAFNVQGIVDSFRNEVDKKVLKIQGSDPELMELVKAQGKLIETLQNDLKLLQGNEGGEK